MDDDSIYYLRQPLLSFCPNKISLCTYMHNFPQATSSASMGKYFMCQRERDGMQRNLVSHTSLPEDSLIATSTRPPIEGLD